MNTKHTPGPWHVGRKQNHGGTTSAERIVSEDGEAICAELSWHDDGEANARLIAAAPELLEMLERCEMWLSTAPDGRAMQRACQAVITKATGKEDA